MMRKFLTFIILLGLMPVMWGQSLQNQRFDKANYYYNESKYDTAVVMYESIVNDGYVSAPLLYNTGNAYFKLRNYPMAILNYEKALKLEPDNDEIKQNLAIANALITDKIEPLPVFFMAKWWKNIGNMLTANGWATLSLIIAGAFLLALFLYFTATTKGLKKSMFFIGIFLIIIGTCTVIFSSQKRKYIEECKEGIVMKTTITVKSSPSSSGTDLFVLHEGTKVQILDQSDNWDKIKIADGSVGWMPSNTTIKF